MSSNIYFPSPKLRNVVARYMINVDDEYVAHWQDTEIIPNGAPALGFSFGEPFEYVKAGGKSIQMPYGGVLGVHTDPYICRRKEPTGMFVIIFRPLALFKFLRNDMDELKNNTTNLELLGIKESPFIAEKLRELPSNRQRVLFIERWLEQKLANCETHYHISEYIVDTIIHRKGMVSIRELEKELSVNRRYMERNFAMRLGVSPKEFAEVTRFSYISSQLIHSPDISWQELAYMGNFYDQAHLIKHFQKLVKATPEKFRKTIKASQDARFVNLLNVTQLFSGIDEVN